jgi:hypothetical protein
MLRTCDLASILGGSGCVGLEIGTEVGLGQIGLGFSLCAVPSQLTGPHISELGRG